jgi:hypothetical protein
MLLAGVALAGLIAQAVPTPVPHAAAANPQVAKRFDPCGGAQELLKKYLAASPCVFVAGQGSVQMTYGGTNAPAEAFLIGAAQTVGVTGYRHVLSYPAPLLNIGITANSQITILLPSFSQITSALTGSVVAGTADMEFSYKNLAYVDSVRGILGGLLLTYAAPTGSPGLAAPGPAYAFNPLLNIALNGAKTIGVSLAFPITNAPASGTERTWSFAPQAVPYWRSPGGTLLALVVRHDFSSSATSLTLNTAQLLTRQFQIQATYGGVNTSIDFANPVEGFARATGTAYPRSFTLGFSYMIGTSELPPQ